MSDGAPATEFVPGEGLAPGGVEGADRRRRAGRWLRNSSLDELPQLWNIVRGEMSLVGPRPERPEFVESFGREIPCYHERHRVRPGITGWAQVNGLRGQTSIEDRVEWDNHYIENWSLLLELRTLALTFAAVLSFREHSQQPAAPAAHPRATHARRRSVIAAPFTKDCPLHACDLQRLAKPPKSSTSPAGAQRMSRT